MRERFDGRVPMLVNGVNSVGRAREWLAEPEAGPAPAAIEAEPCTLADWPLVAFDGTIVACGNDDVVDGPAPAHLRLGHADTDGWPEIRERCVTSRDAARDPHVRARSTSADRDSARRGRLQRLLHDVPAALGRPGARAARVEAVMARPSAAFLDASRCSRWSTGGRARRSRAAFGMAALRRLVMLGAPEASASMASPSLGWGEIEAIRTSAAARRCCSSPTAARSAARTARSTRAADSPTITDFELFGEILDWICEQDALEVVGISGGEPFVERRGLTLAVRRFTDAGKRVVLYTSGVWATRPQPPAWIAEVLDRATTVCLSTDAFHEEGVADATT